MNGIFEPFSPRRNNATHARQGMLARLRAFLRDRPDREHEIILNRLVICPAGLVYLNLARAFGFHDWTLQTLWLDLYLAAYSIGLAAHLWRYPGVSPGRRLAGIVCDMAAISALMHFGGQYTAVLYPIFLWVIFGYGFRFGVSYLFAAAGCAFVMFAAVARFTPYWSQNWSVSVGMLLGLAALPAYVSILIRQLSEAKRLAEEANKAKTLFLASVSHELRTPLNAIIGLSDLLADGKLDEEQVDMSRVIGRSGRSLLSLINSILEISKMECGYPNAKVDDVDAYAFLADLRDMLTVQAKAKGLRFGLNIAHDAPRYAAFNTRHVEEILVNLAGNAIKFTERGHVMISLEARAAEDGTTRLRFEVTDTGIGIAPDATTRIFDRFTQADETIIDQYGGTGLGLAIAKQLVEGMGGRIGVESVLGVGSTFWFEIVCATSARVDALARVDDIYLLSRDPDLRALAANGSASIAMMTESASLVAALEAAHAAGRRHLVAIVDARDEEHGHPERLIEKVYERVESFDVSLIGVFAGAGARLSRETASMVVTSLEIPVTQEDLTRALVIATIDRRKEAPAVAAPRPSAENIRMDILVAEDNRTNQLVIRKILERSGHLVTLVADGQAALEKLNEKRFDLALMDVNMPVMNGVDAAKLYQFSAPGHQRTPIAALTADATVETQRRCLDAGMIACITKPVEPVRLAEWLDAFAIRNVAGTRPDEAPAPVAEEPAPGESEAIDDRAINDLKSLGGEEFVSEIVDQFLGDAANVLKNLHAAVEEGDVQRFRDEAHALRSCAANVGAQKVYKLCLEWRAIDARELAIEGELRIRRLESEFEKAREALAIFRRSEAN